MATVTVSNNPDASRYEAVVDGQVAGFAEYMLTDDMIVFTHTEVSPDFEGQGVGSALAKGALGDVRASAERSVMPLCPFIKAYMEKHPEYADLAYNKPTDH